MRQKLGLSWVKRQRRWPGRLIGYLGSGDPRVLPALVVEIIAIMVGGGVFKCHCCSSVALDKAIFGVLDDTVTKK